MHCVDKVTPSAIYCTRQVYGRSVAQIEVFDMSHSPSLKAAPRTQPKSARKQSKLPRALYYLFFPTHHSLIGVIVASSEAAAFLVYTPVCPLIATMRLRI